MDTGTVLVAVGTYACRSGKTRFDERTFMVDLDTLNCAARENEWKHRGIGHYQRILLSEHDLLERIAGLSVLESPVSRKLRKSLKSGQDHFSESL